MSQTPDEPSFSVYDGGEEIALPATVGGIRRALASELRPEFDSAVETTPAQDLYGELAAWALKTRPDLLARQEETFRRLERGDFTGFTPAEDIPELALLDEEGGTA
ncbi:hypothetical protein ACFV0R_28300 [Streptomyces sp. NPDC059578]|uniref:hypothetical protein n=1 Tax=unclassified Streptomyces TaxID=2593676 RepID=UPI00366286F0